MVPKPPDGGSGKKMQPKVQEEMGCQIQQVSEDKYVPFDWQRAPSTMLLVLQ
jgi:hypothetical protein